MALSGTFLMAAPGMVDPNFRRTVVLVLEHDDSGTFGLVINRPGPIHVGIFCAGLGIEWRGAVSEPVYVGGPVQPMVGWLLHDPCSAAHESRPVRPDLAVSNSREMLELLASEPGARRRLYAGYAGWAPGQLAAELKQGAWLRADGDADLVFGASPEAMWNQAVGSLGIDPLLLVPGESDMA